ncbi:MAG: hypothetical protein KBF37_08630 [Saprospiraceae bacterium]|jgi:hypothetical protein|nr:hypothetical protein [Saprospiraceae bacterium]MBP9210370.1 hypothetical protein [Saprospiraceae bacterium]MBV6473934.1 hypothetical protein [Saprospiraceae bacterium]MCC6754017.1 hypothetical protein [Saprospiraceae bacterium]
MKNPFKRREKKNPAGEAAAEGGKKALPTTEEQTEVLELQPHGEFLETDEDLGYC